MKRTMKMLFLNKATSRLEEHEVVLTFLKEEGHKIYVSLTNPITKKAALQDMSTDTWHLLQEAKNI